MSESVLTTRIVMADDHPTFRLGLKQIIAQEPGFEIVGETGNGMAALDMIRRLSPAIAVVDWDMPGMDGLELTRLVRTEGLPTRLIMLTMHDEESLVNEVVEAGVDGFVLKDNAIDDIQACLEAVRDGKSFLSPAVAHHVMRRHQKRAAVGKAHPGLVQLTPMERRVLGHVGEGMATKEIAAALSISPRTVDTHRRNLCEKLGLRGSHSLLQFAKEHHQLF